MGKILTLARRELAGYFFSPMAYVIGALFLAFSGIVFFHGLPLVNIEPIFESGREASLRTLFEAMAWAMVVTAPLLTMRLLSEEYRSGTIETLMTAPVTDAQVVLGKFLGVMGFYLVLLATTAVFMVIIAVFGQPDPGVAVAGYVGLILVGCMFVSVGIFASTLTPYQIVAGIVGIAILGGIIVLMHLLALYAPDPINHAASKLNAMTYASGFSRGTWDSRGIAFFVTGSFLFLFLSVKMLESRRWR
jgi:ABC-2 type transport system permease protein